MEWVFHTIPDGVALIDPQGRFTYWNAVAQDLLNITEHRLVAPEAWVERFRIFLEDGLTPCPQARFPVKRALEGDSVVRQVFCLKNGKGPRWLDVSARPLLDTLGFTIEIGRAHV